MNELADMQLRSLDMLLQLLRLVAKFRTKGATDSFACVCRRVRSAYAFAVRMADPWQQDDAMDALAAGMRVATPNATSAPTL